MVIPKTQGHSAGAPAVQTGPAQAPETNNMAFCAIVLSGLFLTCQTIRLSNGYKYQPKYSQSLHGSNHYKNVSTKEDRPNQDNWRDKIFDHDDESQEHQASPNRYDNNASVPYMRNSNHNNEFSGVEHIGTINKTHVLYDYMNVNLDRAVIDGVQVSNSNWGLNAHPYNRLNEGLATDSNLDAPAIAGGETADSSTASPLQWHVGIYSKAFVPYMQICGGTLVTPKAVISAAHCFWSDLDGALPPTACAVATGKLYRPWNDPHDIYAQKSEISAVHLPPRFRGAITSFQDDIAVVTLASALAPSNAVRPVCVLFDEDLENVHLRTGNHGIVLGWGLTAENGPPAQVLQYLAMPYVPIEKCVDDAPPDFLKYITSDKICAGVTTGKALCRGDSGGGLVFFDRSTGDRAPFLFGVASTAPRNANLCNAYARATLTRVLAHRKFLRAHVPDVEQTCGDNYKAFVMPHKADLVGLADRSSETQPTRTTQPKYICNCYCNCSNFTKG